MSDYILQHSDEILQRLVHERTHHFFFATEVARYLDISAKTLRRLVSRGEFPAALELSAQIRAWVWTDVWWYVYGIKLGPRLRGSDGQLRSTRRQLTPTEDKPRTSEDIRGQRHEE